MKKHSLFKFFLVILLITHKSSPQTASVQEYENKNSKMAPQQIKPFLWGAGSAAIGIGIFFITKGKIKAPIIKFPTFPWNRRHQEELKKVRNALDRVNTDLMKHKDILESYKYDFLTLHSNISAIKKDIQVIKTDVSLIQKNTATIKKQTTEMHSIMNRLCTFLEENKKPVNGLLTWIKEIQWNSNKIIPTAIPKHPSNISLNYPNTRL